MAPLKPSLVTSAPPRQPLVRIVRRNHGKSGKALRMQLDRVMQAIIDAASQLDRDVIGQPLPGGCAVRQNLDVDARLVHFLDAQLAEIVQPWLQRRRVHHVAALEMFDQIAIPEMFLDRNHLRPALCAMKLSSRIAVMSALRGRTADALIHEAVTNHLFGAIDVAQIDEHGRSHDPLEPLEIERTELFPFGDDDHRIRILCACVRPVAKVTSASISAAPVHARRIIGAHARAQILQRGDERHARAPRAYRRCWA